MKKISLISLTLILAATSLFADNVKALGSSFSLLIPDNYEDVKSFPDRLNLEEASHFEVGGNVGIDGTGFLGYSNAKGNFKSRHEIISKTVSVNTSKYGGGSTSDIEYFDFKNQVGFHLGSINFGITAHGAKDYSFDESSSFTEYYENNDAIRISGHNNQKSHENWEGHFGISTGLGESKSLSISLNCDLIDYNEEYRTNYSTEYTSSDSISNRNNSEIRKESNSLMYTDFNLSIIKDFGKKNNQSRFYTKIGYRMLDRDDNFKFHGKYNFGSSPEYYYSKRHSQRDNNSGDGYNLTIGFGNVKKKGRLQIYSAIQGAVRYIELDNKYHDNVKYEETGQDTTESYFFDRNDENEYYAEMQLPFGLSYTITNWCKVYGSLALISDYEKRDTDSYEFSEYKWSVSSKQCVSLELMPLDNLLLGIYNMDTLSKYKNWEVMAKYSF